MMQAGDLTVTRDGETRITLLGRPHHVNVRFTHEHHPHPCNPHHYDELNYFIDHEDEMPYQHREIPHIHKDRQYVLVIRWKVSDLRFIHWSVAY